MAWTEKLSSGRYRGRYRDADGTQQTVLDGRKGFVRKRDAKAAADDAEVKAQRRAATATRPAAKITWGEWWDRVKDDRDNPETDTASRETTMVRLHIMPWWQDEPLNQIKRADVQRWVDHPRGLKVRTGMSPAYVRRIYNVFRATMTQAMKDGGPLDATPCVGIELPRIPKRRKAHYTTEQVAGIDRDDYRRAAEFIMETGLRPGELCGLHDDHIDRETGWMRVWHVYVSGRHVIRAKPKDDDERWVPLTPRALELITEATEGRKLTGGCGIPHTDGKGCRSALTFLRDDGQPIKPRVFRAWLNRHGMPGLYAGRRGWVTRAAAGGMSPFDIAAAAGHSDMRETQGYWQQTPAMRGRMIAALGQHEGLSIVEQDDARGADRGAEPGNTVTHDEASDRTGNDG